MSKTLTENDPFYSATQTRQFLGNMSEMTLYRRIKEDADFPTPSVVGNRRFWRKSEITAYMEKKRRPVAARPLSEESVAA